MNHLESLMHYIWQYRLFPSEELVTMDGCKVEILGIGQHNLDQGPDFLNARIRLDGLIWAGSVEMHIRSGDWLRHHHNTDPVFNTVILHVVSEHENGVEARLENGRPLPELIIHIPDELKEGYEGLVKITDYPRCYSCIPNLDRLKVNSWLDALLIERMNDRWHRINHILQLTGEDWNRTAFVMLARSMGAGLNSDPMELWALSAVSSPKVSSGFASQKGSKGSNSNQILAMFRHMRCRPSNYPERRIEQLTDLYKSNLCTMDDMLQVQCAEDLFRMFADAGIRKTTARMLIINACSPLLFAYGLHTDSQELRDLAMDILSGLKGEDNYILRQWKACHLQVDTAADSQALIQLKKQYCDHQRCLECRFGFEYLSTTARY